MGLYLNEKHPEIYRMDEDPESKNQMFYHYSHQEEKRKEQALFNASIQKNLSEMRRIYHEQQTEKLMKWKEWDTSYEEVIRKLNIVSEENNQLLKKIDHQVKTQDELQEKLNAQVKNEGVITQRMDEQDAVLNKITQQLSFLRNSLFERTSFLAEKIEGTANSILQLIKKKDAHRNKQMIIERESKPPV